MLSKPRKERTQVVVLLEVTSNSVRGALIRYASNWKIRPEIISHTKNHYDFRDDTFDSYVQALQHALVETLQGLGRVVPEEIHVMLGAPWVTCQTRIIKLEKNTPFVCTSKVLKDLIEKEIKKIEISIPKSEISGDAVVIEKQTMQVRLNGYAVEDPIDKKATSLDLSLFVSIAESDVLVMIKGKIEHVFNEHPIIFHSTAFSHFVLARDLFSEIDDFILIDVGGKITELTLVRNKETAQSVSFPFGTETILNFLKETMSRSKEEVESLLVLYQEKRLDTARMKRINTGLSDLLQLWRNQFQEALVYITDTPTLPSVCILLSEERLRDTLRWFIEKEQFTQYSLTQKQFHVIPLEGRRIVEACLIRTEKNPDHSILLHTLFINRMR